jgi:hypothetical protein
VRICQLEDLDSIAELITQLQSPQATQPTGGGQRPVAKARPAPAKKNVRAVENTPSSETASAQTPQPPQDTEPAQGNQPSKAITAENAAEIWIAAISQISGMAAEQARQYDRAEVSRPNHLVISFKPGYALAKSVCEKPEQLAKFKAALANVTGAKVGLEFRLSETPGDERRPAAAPKSESPHQKLMEVTKHPMVHRAGELFGAQPMRVDDPPKREK